MTDKQTDFFGEQVDATVEQVLKNIDVIDVEDLKNGWPQRLVEAYEVISAMLKKLHPEMDSHPFTVLVLKALSEYFGGQSFYLPKNQRMEILMRDIAIYKDFNGRNVGKLAKKYRVSEQTIYTAIAKQRDLRQRKLDL